MLTRKTPDTFNTTLHVKGQGVPEFKFNVTYTNRKQEDVEAVLAEAGTHAAAKADPQYPNRQCLLYIIADWESEYALTDADIKAMEDDRPGMIELLFIGYHKSRRVEAAKN